MLPRIYIFNSLSSLVRAKLFLDNSILAVPFRTSISDPISITYATLKPVRSSEVFTEKCADDAFPASNSFTTFSPRVNFINWLIIVNTDNHDLFEAHPLRQLKGACESISYVFIFISFEEN